MKIANYKIVFLGILISVPVLGLSQSNMFYYQPEKTWEYGPRIGFTTSMINSKGDPNIQRGVKLGIVGGLFSRYQLTNQWAIQGDLSYSTRGNKNNITNIENSYVDFSITPVRNVRYRMFKQDMTFDFFIGPGISFNTSTKEKLGVISNLNGQLSTTEINLVMGGGFPIGPVLLYATTRFGISNLLDNPLTGSTWNGFTTEWTASYRFK